MGMVIARATSKRRIKANGIDVKALQHAIAIKAHAYTQRQQ